MKKNLVWIILFVLFFASSLVYAGTLTPSATPAATSYTLEDIYTKLTTNASATLADHTFTPGGAPGGTLYTLTQLYGAIPTIDASKVKLGTPYLGVAGSLTPDGGTATVAGLFNGLTAHLTGDWTLDTGTLDLACNTSTFNATANLVATAYDGAGDGTNRWCMTSSGDAVAGDIASGKIAWVDGAEVTGSAGAGYTYGDNNASYVLGTATGAGTALKNLYSGSAASGDYPQSVGGVDDYNNGGTMPADAYNKSWTTCNSDNTYCGTGDSTNAEKKDDSTGLVWSIWLDSGTAHNWFWANNSQYPNGLPGDDGVCNTNGEVACKSVKLTSSKTGCEALGDGGWRLPYHKELLQAYIDGSWNNLSSSNTYYWSATTNSRSTNMAWPFGSYNGSHPNITKTTSASYKVRCVR